jgi:hypothetical protein
VEIGANLTIVHLCVFATDFGSAIGKIFSKLASLISAYFAVSGRVRPALSRIKAPLFILPGETIRSRAG